MQDTWIQYKAGLIDEEVWQAECWIMSVSFTQSGFLDWSKHGQQFLTRRSLASITWLPQGSTSLI